jgi:hypothetical protein
MQSNLLKKRQLSEIELKKDAINTLIAKNEAKRSIPVQDDKIIHFPFITLITENSPENKVYPFPDTN